MSNNLWKSLLVNPVLLSATLTVSATIGIATAANASEIKVDTTAPSTSLDQLNAYSNEGVVSANDAGQVTSVSQLSDVRPTDWAFQALQSLVERYGCIAGYPDRTYRGNRALTRYEFAAGLNACLDRVNELIAASTADLVKKEDLATLQTLQEQFAAELATLRGRVDSLEARTTTLEKQQFSTTTKLQGEAIFSISGAQGDSKAVSSLLERRAAETGAAVARPDVDDNTTFSNRVRLSLRTSFTGQDTLLTRIQARNITDFAGAAGTNMADLSYEGGRTADNSAFVDKLFYRFPIGQGGAVTIDAINGEFYNNVNNFNPLLASDSQGSISRFGRFNPIYRQGASGSGSGAGVTLNYPLSQAFTVSLGYLADNGNDPTDKNGLFNGSNAALAQLAFKPSSNIDLGFTYVRSYDRLTGASVSSGTGSALSNNPFGNFINAGGVRGSAVSADHFGVQGSFKVTPGLVLSGWGGLTKAHAENRATNADATILNWAVGLAFPDLGGKGNMAGLIFGMPPKVTDSDLVVNGIRQEDEDTSFHLEGLYRLRLNDKISITPGIIVLFNPEHNNANDTVYVGTIRTTFSF
ncbi:MULTISPECIES: iron uptake porin [Leptolyngbya]|uniref:iron uptake porin n=1 Tax=Leptolyngbya TaxID=47251 RepID=UPI0016890DFE|nr:iron uptake porin [Leptolyngbya sp. FACHB-1624]MBD1857308.1 carbohydrate porin [Leptolyngbya sp. FACHB-1624]